MSITINFWAVLVSAVVSLLIGSLWFGPLFGRKYMVAMGMDKWTKKQQQAMRKKMLMSFVLQFAASLVMFFVFALFVGKLGFMGVRGGILTALWVWIGFVVPLKLGDALWGGNMILFWLSISSMFVTLLFGGVIIGAWG